jgi:hypothetical protein
MNDFTKYELQSLLWAIEYVRKRTNNCGDIMRKLERDINYMIDNYCGALCNHQWFRCLYGENSIPIRLCALCNLREKI